MGDVARVANVSMATVSRIISGQASVTPQMRERVLKTAVRLGFDFDRGRKSRIIAFLLSNRGVLHPFHSSILMGAEAFCAEHEYALLFLPLQYPTNVSADELSLPEILQRHDIISGVIAAGTNSQHFLDVLTRRGTPWVALGNNILGARTEGENVSVYFDDVQGAYEMTRYLQALGHQRIGFVGNLRMPWYSRRFEGYKRAMLEEHLEIRSSESKSRDGEEMGYLATRVLLQESPAPTAIFAGDDSAARGAYKAASDCGLRIPEHLSVAGFNDTLEASSLHPALTSVRVFTDELGKQLAELLLRKITRPDVPARTMTLPTQLIKRESCASISPQLSRPNDPARQTSPIESH